MNIHKTGLMLARYTAIQVIRNFREITRVYPPLSLTRPHLHLHNMFPLPLSPLPHAITNQNLNNTFLPKTSPACPLLSKPSATPAPLFLPLAPLHRLLLSLPREIMIGYERVEWDHLGVRAAQEEKCIERTKAETRTQIRTLCLRHLRKLVSSLALC
jgi:hypothetical protein